MRKIYETLLAAQKAVSATPYIRIYINDTDYSARLLTLEHHEEAYRERATLVLRNDDLHFNSVDLLGKQFEIGYGHTVDSTNYYTGDGTSEPGTAPLWVKNQMMVSAGGQLYCILYAEGMWMRLRETRIMAGVITWKADTAFTVGRELIPTIPNGHKYECTTAGTSGATEPTWTTVSGGTVTDGSVIWTEVGTGQYGYGTLFNATHTVEELMEMIFEIALSWTFHKRAEAREDGTTCVSDSIIDVFKPVFNVNQMPYETAAGILYRLIWMTECYLRATHNTTFELVYPQTDDAVAETFYSDQAHYFFEYTEKVNLLIPNSIAVVCNEGLDEQWTEALLGTAKDDTEIAKYAEIIQPFVAASITTQGNADNRAAAILQRLKSETLAGRLVVPHDARVELYDRVSIVDRRGL